MKLVGCVRVLDEREIELIHRGMLRILSEVGMRIENDAILSRLGDLGGEVDRRAQLVRFAPEFVEGFIAGSEKYDWDNVQPQVFASAGVYLGRYLDPDTDEYLPWTEERIAGYAKLARHLEHVGRASMLGCPIEGVPNAIHPLYQRYICWRYGMAAGGSIWDIRLCPYILEMCGVMGESAGRDAASFFTGGVYLSTTLLFPANEAEQYVYFAERGLPVAIGHMTSAGGSAPVTLAGAAALHLAEGIVINIIQRAFYGRRTLDVSSTVAPLDMRSLMYAYGRPERQIVNLVMADMARRYGASFSGHGGHTDAKRPSAEAGAQRALTTIPTLMSCGRAHVGAGLLSSDEIGSPIQMIIDNEYVGALKRFARGCEISEETLAVDVVKEVGPGNLFMDTDHTARHFRDELWEPCVWSRELFASWMPRGGKSDVDNARELYHEIMSQPDPPPGISGETEKELRKIMDRATAALS